MVEHDLLPLRDGVAFITFQHQILVRSFHVCKNHRRKEQRRENNHVMSLRFLTVAPWMAAVAGVAIILITLNFTMVIIGILAVMLVAIDTLEGVEVVGDIMAIGAGIPFIPVLSRKDGEVLRIMIPGRWCPGCGGVTILAGGGESHDIMIGIIGVVVIGGVA